MRSLERLASVIQRETSEERGEEEELGDDGGGVENGKRTPVATSATLENAGVGHAREFPRARRTRQPAASALQKPSRTSSSAPSSSPRTARSASCLASSSTPCPLRRPSSRQVDLVAACIHASAEPGSVLHTVLPQLDTEPGSLGSRSGYYCALRTWNSLLLSRSSIRKSDDGIMPALVRHSPRQAWLPLQGASGTSCPTATLPRTIPDCLCTACLSTLLDSTRQTSQIGGYWEDKTPASDKPF